MHQSSPATNPFDFLDDPNSWVQDTHEHRVYLDDSLELYAIVDAIDYSACVRMMDVQGKRGWIACRWSSLGAKWKVTNNPKHYARRSIYEQHGPETEKYESPITGKLVRNRQRTNRSIFLHHFIAQRAGIVPPTNYPPGIKWKLDHRNGNSLDCRRANLRWVTPKFNSANQHGKLAHVELDDWHRQQAAVC